MILSIICTFIAFGFYALKELAAHGKLKWHDSVDLYSFFGATSYLRKYKTQWVDDHVVGREKVPVKAPKTWYYRFFKIKYKERFPLSATLLVFLTDGMHLCQWAFKIFLALSFVPFTGWIWAGIIWLTMGVSFTVFYKLMSK